MNKLEGALKEIQNFLKDRGIPYMIIGGIGNLVWGEPRMTVDIDITVHISDTNERDFIKETGSKFKVLVGNPDEFVKKTRVLPIEITESVKGDIIFTGLEYEKMAIERAVEVEISKNINVRVCTAEDLIIYKAISEREKDWQDIEGILLRRGALLDKKYILNWLSQFASALDKPGIKKRFEGLWKEIVEGSKK
ncbi:MAG: nucleotidyltransferase [Euryarchaeota archaeon]|nr:nucleotidyltransferase [Euryarchaeota archaeon]MBU4339889.1 nucleotidyltransferase [Euryarchaeota archaeon]MBU4453642.1 nucleotidyltransferase [Euryarchaeota archaeon]MCG2735274.1 nucleotidyltransferase [Candidatus Methanoperedenaceae archaeon]